jgi:hypothetical protein
MLKRIGVLMACCSMGLIGGALFEMDGRSVRANAETEEVPAYSMRQYYLSQTQVVGSAALQACATGYHMASLWEIHEPSNLKYNTKLGVTTTDSGFGPPTYDNGMYLGWVRTGYRSYNPDTPGEGNCDAWTSTDGWGTTVFLPSSWSGNAPSFDISPWWNPNSGTSCSSQQSVWCVQN